MKKTKYTEKEIKNEQEVKEIPIEVVLGLILKSIGELAANIEEIKKKICDKPSMK